MWRAMTEKARKKPLTKVAIKKLDNRVKDTPILQDFEAKFNGKLPDFIDSS